MSDKNVELGLISCLMKDKETAYKSVAELRYNYFEDKGAKEIFKLMVESVIGGEECDDMSLMIKAGKEGVQELAEVGIRLSDVDEMVETPANYELYRNRIIASFRNRTMLKALKGQVEIMENAKDTDDSLVNESVSAINGVFAQMGEGNQKAKKGDELLKEVIEMVVEKCNNPVDENELGDAILSFGIPSMDREFGMIRKGEYVVICARPSLGKTSKGVQLITHNCHKFDKKIMVFSLESPASDLIEISASQWTGTNTGEVHTKDKLTHKLWKEEAENLDLGCLMVYDTIFDIETIEAKIRLHVMMGEVDVIMIDYLQLVSVSNKENRGFNRESQIAYISRRIRQLTIELGIPIIVMAQLNRDVEKENRPPKKSDLRESGSIEQDATRIIAIHRPMTDKDGNNQMNDDRDDYYTHLMQLKMKKGKVIQADCIFKGKEQKFYELDNSNKEYSAQSTNY